MKEYNNGVFPRSLCISKSIDEVNELFDCPFTDSKKFEVIEDANAVTCCANYKNQDKGCLLLLIQNEIGVSTICHESLHIVRIMMEDLPCNLTDDTEEVWCYMMGWVADCIMSYMSEQAEI